MKKMLTISAALVCGAVMAIESANVVGYNNYNARTGFNLYTPQFKSIGGSDSFNINDVQLGESTGDMGANLQLISADGVSAAYYNWLTAATAKEFGYTDGSKGCWVDSELVLVEDITLKFGGGVQIDTLEQDDALILSSGQVSDDDMTYEAGSGFNFVGNAFPSNINIGNVQLSEEIGDMGANLQLINSVGASMAYYNWMTPATAKEFGYTDGSVGCWVDAELLLVSDVSLNAGDGFQVDTLETSRAFITVLSPIEL